MVDSKTSLFQMQLFQISHPHYRGLIAFQVTANYITMYRLLYLYTVSCERAH